MIPVFWPINWRNIAPTYVQYIPILSQHSCKSSSCWWNPPKILGKATQLSSPRDATGLFSDPIHPAAAVRPPTRTRRPAAAPPLRRAASASHPRGSRHPFLRKVWVWSPKNGCKNGCMENHVKFTFEEWYSWDWPIKIWHFSLQSVDLIYGLVRSNWLWNLTVLFVTHMWYLSLKNVVLSLKLWIQPSKVWKSH